MKILFLADVNSSHTRKWVLGLRENGIAVAIFSMSAPREDWYTRVDVECAYFGADPSLQDKQSAFAKLSYLKAVAAVKRFVKEIKPDILHAHYATSYGMLGALSGKRPYLISVWGSDVQDFPYRSFLHKKILSLIFKRADIICSTSDSMLKDIDFVGAKAKVKLPFGIDLDEFKMKKHLAKDQVIFGTIKTMDEVYGIDVLLRAFALYIKKTNWDDKLFLYGKGPQTDKLKILAKELKIDHLVEFKGYAYRKVISESYHSLDVYLSLSRRESYGVAALEASASGLPLITSKAEGFFEVVDEGQTGFRLDIDDLDGITEKMMILRDVDLRKEMGTKGRFWVETNFNFEEDVLKQKQLYISVLNV